MITRVAKYLLVLRLGKGQLLKCLHMWGQDRSFLIQLSSKLTRCNMSTLFVIIIRKNEDFSANGHIYSGVEAVYKTDGQRVKK